MIFLYFKIDFLMSILAKKNKKQRDFIPQSAMISPHQSSGFLSFCHDLARAGTAHSQAAFDQ